MKKITLLVSVLLLLGLVVLPVYAKSDNANANAKAAQGKAGGTNELNVEGEEEEPEELSKSELAKQKNTIRKLNRITEKVNDPEVGEQIQEMAQVQEQIENDAEEAIQNANQRSNQLKYVIGPDYKNLGDLRSQVVHARNNIRKLEKIQESAGVEVQGDISSAVMEMKEKAYELQASMYEELSSFSLFGWLFRWMNGFELEPVVIEDPVPDDGVEISGTITPEPSTTIYPTTTVTISPVVTEVVEPTITEVEPTITLDPGI